MYSRYFKYTFLVYLTYTLPICSTRPKLTGVTKTKGGRERGEGEKATSKQKMGFLEEI
jgi:hypothetical protein